MNGQRLKTYYKNLIRFLIVFLCVFNLWSFIFGLSTSQESTVYILKFAGPIGPVSADYIISGIGEAEKANAIGIILKLDTPGGLDESMREIIQRILSSKVPVVVYISPSGARAASAGVFITMSADYAVMMPSTNIGAAHPVSISGKEVTSEMQEKITNDAASYIISIAEKRNRNKTWAEQAVRQSVSASADEAVKLNVVDFIASTDAELYTKLDSITNTRQTALTSYQASFVSAEKKEMPMNGRQRFLLFLTNPNVAYILLMLGIYGLFFELQSPGAIFPGVFGSVALILAFYSLHLLPTNYVALALIGLAIIFFVLEVYITSYGLLTIGGISSLILGSLFLFQSPVSYFRLALPVIIVTTVLTILFFSIIISLAVRAHKKKVTTGKEGLLTEIGTAVTDIENKGTIMIHGELWSAESVSGKINKGEKVEVVKVYGMTLSVKRSSQ